MAIKIMLKATKTAHDQSVQKVSRRLIAPIQLIETSKLNKVAMLKLSKLKGAVLKVAMLKGAVLQAAILKASILKASILKTTMLSGVCLIVGCQSNSDPEPPVITDIDPLIKSAAPACQAALTQLGQELIGVKSASLTPLASLTRLTKRPDNNANTLSSPLSSPLSSLLSSRYQSYTGTLVYNDRPSHLLITTLIDDKNHCHVSYQLDYQLDLPCFEAREEAFRKWQLKTVLNEQTRLYQHQHYPHKHALLTDISRNLQCLIRVQVGENSEGTNTADNLADNAAN